MPSYEWTPAVAWLRDHLIAEARAMLVRLDNADPNYGFGAEIRRLRARIDDLLDGKGILVYRFELPRELGPPRDGRHVFTLKGDDRLVDAEYERVVPVREP